MGNLSPSMLISESFVRPKYKPAESEQPYYLSPGDIFFMSQHYMQPGLLFAKPSDSSFEILPFLNKLKTAISIALVHFYPLAGGFVTVTCQDENSCWVYLDCNKGPGARIIHAVCSDVTVNDVVLNRPDMIPIVRSFFELGEEGVLSLHGHSRSLLSVQVTELIDGLFIGFTMNHSVADGSSLWHFINTLSEIFSSIGNNDDDNYDQNNITISHKPTYKSFFPDGYGPIIKIPYLDINDFIAKFPVSLDQNLREIFFHFSPASVAKLKAQANAKYNTFDGEISSFQSVASFLWKSITKARARARNLGSENVATITVVADARTRIESPLPIGHFGNMLALITKSCKFGELLENDLGWVAMLLNKSIKSIDDKVVRQGNKMVLEIVLHTEFIPSALIEKNNVVHFGGSSRFNCYGSEFGLGKAIAARKGYSAKKDGKITVREGREGGGSMDFEVCLSPEVMDALESDEDFMSFVS